MPQNKTRSIPSIIFKIITIGFLFLFLIALLKYVGIISISGNVPRFLTSNQKISPTPTITLRRPLLVNTLISGETKTFINDSDTSRMEPISNGFMSAGLGIMRVDVDLTVESIKGESGIIITSDGDANSSKKIALIYEAEKQEWSIRVTRDGVIVASHRLFLNVKDSIKTGVFRIVILKSGETIKTTVNSYTVTLELDKPFFDHNRKLSLSAQIAPQSEVVIDQLQAQAVGE